MKTDCIFDTTKIVLKNTFFVDKNYSEKHAHIIHAHGDVMELLYIHSGSGRYIVGNRVYAVQSGDIVICNQDILHGEAPFQKHNIQTYCCAFSGISIKGLGINQLLSREEKPIISLTPEKEQCFSRLMPVIHSAFRENRRAAQYLALGALLLTYEEIRAKTEDDTVFQQEQKNENLVRKVTNYIDLNYKKDITLAKISEEMYVSPSRLSHVFKEETGLSPIQYVIQRRIGEAQSLLVETNELIRDIETSLGFCSSVHFSMMFKKYVGIPPKVYRDHFYKNKNDIIKE